MAPSSPGCTVSSVRQPPQVPAAPVEAPVETLLEVVRRQGTPTYAYDLGRVRAQVTKLRAQVPAHGDERDGDARNPNNQFLPPRPSHFQ